MLGCTRQNMLSQNAWPECRPILSLHFREASIVSKSTALIQALAIVLCAASVASAKTTLTVWNKENYQTRGCS